MTKYKINMKKPFVLAIAAGLLTVMSCNNQNNVTVGDFASYPAYTKGDLGLTYTPQASTIKLWAPSADCVQLNVYDQGSESEAIETVQMERGAKGTWKATLKGDRKGQFYTFQVTTEGKTLSETPGVWNKAVGVNGLRAAIIDLADTNPEGWTEDKHVEVKNHTDIVIYEMHHRDFSISDNSGITNKGKFLALTEKGTLTPEGLASGIDHLKELGITHVHILPSYDYGSIDEAHLEQGNYNWGYDPKNYNVPEGGYSTNPFAPEVRIREMKQMVQALHEAGIGVIMDVVYNHTFVNDESNFSLTVPGYYYRQTEEGDYSNASGCGNETASERPMVRHYIVESVKYWANEFHIDGFRFDLMAIHDIETMNTVRQELDKINPGIFVYGEGWMASSTPLPAEQQASKHNGMKFPRIAVFSDDIRDGLRGEWMSAGEGGFATGKVTQRQRESIKFGVVGATQHPQVDYSKVNYSGAPYANNPVEVINYVSCHDDECLRDKIDMVAKDATPAQRKRMDLLAQTIVMTSQGVPFIFCGEELYRTKQHIRNTYNLPDEINRIDWSHKAKYADVFAYYKGLIQMRRQHPAFHMATTEQVVENLHFVDSPEGTVVYTLNGAAVGDEWSEVYVVLNGNRGGVNVQLPVGEWNIVCEDGKMQLDEPRAFGGGEFWVHGTSALIAFRK